MEESSVLRRQLTELAEMCQEFAKKLSEKEQQLSKQQQVTVDNALEKVNDFSVNDLSLLSILSFWSLLLNDVLPLLTVFVIGVTALY